MSDLNLESIKNVLEKMDDVIYKEYKCGSQLFTLVYVESITDIDQISEFVVKPLLSYGGGEILNANQVIRDVIPLSSATKTNDLNEAVIQVLSGNILIFFSAFSEVISCEVKDYNIRNVEKSETETVIKGPREGFVENLQTNISSIRRRIISPDLKIEIFSIGQSTKTDVAMFYLKGTTPEELIDYVKERLLEIDKRNFVFYSNALEEKLKTKWSPFDTIGYTEKPDIAASKISEGKVVVMFNGTPFAVSAPYFFVENFMAPDDYTLNIFMGNIGRALRFLAFASSTLLPGFYLALVTHHFRLIPSIFLFKLAILRTGVPVPTFIELIFMLFLFQIIREAAVRLPQPLGSTLSIVGALILGDAAVRSGLASQMTVVVVGITSISSYLIPKIYIGVFTWNIILIIFSAVLGLPGFYTGFVLFVAHIANLDSCGYPFLYPMGTKKSYKFKDYTYRGHLSKISKNMLQKDDK